MSSVGAPPAPIALPESTARTPARFIRGVFARVLLLLVGTAALNFVVNPAGSYPTHFFEPIVVSSRRPKMALYTQHRPIPRIVVLGSSRSFAADPAYIEKRTGQPTFNASVHAAGTPDYLDLVRCIAATGHPFPGVVLVGLGVEQMLIHLPARAERADPLAECRSGAAPGPLARLSAYRDLLAAREAVASLRLLTLEVSGRPAPAYTFGVDGELHSALPSRPLAEAVDAGLSGNWRPSTFAADRLDEKSVADFSELLEFCRAHGARVVVYLPPYHPRAVALYAQESHFESLRRQVLERLPT